MSSSAPADDELVTNFCAITGASPDQARFFLDSSAGALDAAISAFYDHGGDADAAAAAAAGAGIGDDGDGTGSRAVAAAAPRDPRAAAVAAAAARAGGPAVGGATDPAMTSHAMYTAGGAEEGGEEVQQRQPRVTAPVAGSSGAAAGGGIGRFVGGVGTGKGNKRSGGGGGGGGGRIRTLGDIGRRRGGGEEDSDDEEDDDDDDREEYYAGGEKSGIAVQDPNKRRGPGGMAGMGPPRAGAMDMDDIFARAQQQGARQGTSADLDAGGGGGGGGGGRRGGGAFSGVGRTLGGAGAEAAGGGGGGAEVAMGQGQGGDAGGEVGEGGRRVVRHTVTFYLNGFTVGDGPLRQLQDPANAAFLKSILERGECPRELQSADPDVDVELNLLRVNQEWTPPPEPKYVAFSGQGRTLAAATEDTPAPSQPRAAPAAATGVMNAQPPAGGLQVDESQPSTSIQLRLADGTRLVARFNHTHTVGHIRAFIDAARPGGAGRRYALQTMGFPPKRLEDDGETIEAAGLVNSVVVQR